MRGSAALRTGVTPGGALAGPWVQNSLWTAARAVPSLDLRFADNKSLVDATTGASLVTFTRASSGTFVGSDGVLRSATTNLLLRSEEFDSAYWSKARATVTANAAISPTGVLSADAIIEDSTASNTHLVFSSSVSVATGTIYTYSIYAKANGRSWFNMQIGTGSEAYGATVPFSFFNVSNGTIGTSANCTATVQPVGDGWYRCILTAVATTAATTTNIRIKLAESSSSDSYTGDGTSGIYIWGAQLEQSSTVGEYIPTTSTINSAPRFDHNPTTGESLGLLVEEQRTNSIRNNTMVGAAAGTPGTNPTNWSLSAAGNNVTKQVVGLGTEDGIPYVDIRYSGTPTAGNSVSIAFEPTNFIAAASGQTWTESVFIKLQAGSFSGTSITLSLLGTDGTAGTENFSSPFITSTPTNLRNGRLSVTATFASASTTRAQPRVRIGFTVGVAFDITLRIGLPQLEQGAFATSVIPTTTAAATRSADVASITGTNFSSWYRQDEGTVFVNATTNATHGGFNSFPRKLSISDGTTSNSIEDYYRVLASYTDAGYRIDAAGVNQAQFDTNNQRNGQSSVIGYAANNFAFAVGGTVVTTDLSGTVPTTTRLRLGQRGDGSAALNGTIRRLTYWPVRLGNNVLQQITQ